MKTLLLGDICPTEITNPFFQSGDINALFDDTVTLFNDRDFIIANLECVLTENEKPIKKIGPPLKASPGTADVLKALGINCLGLSNNHVFDYGVAGIKDTLKELERANISYTGFGNHYEDSRKNFVFQKDNETICIIAVCEHEYSYALEHRMGSRPYDEYDTIEDIREAKKKYDRVIVLYHGGKEFCRYPSPRLRKLCQAMARNGADVILCQHSHCIGCYEKYKNCHILYGQGNFHFVKPYAFDGWHTSLAVEYDTKRNEINFIPLQSTDTGIQLAKGEAHKEIIDAFNERNKQLLNGEWKDGWHDFCEEMKDAYLSVVANACEKNHTEREYEYFAHYLDCEAHTDVWRELFRTSNATNETDL